MTLHLWSLVLHRLSGWEIILLLRSMGEDLLIWMMGHFKMLFVFLHYQPISSLFTKSLILVQAGGLSSHPILWSLVRWQIVFSKFVPKTPSVVLLTHLDEVRRLWHEQFGQLNYHYLQQLNKKSMVTRLPDVRFSDGVCQGCILSKHPEDKFDKGKAWRDKNVLELVHNDLMLLHI